MKFKILLEDALAIDSSHKESIYYRGNLWFEGLVGPTNKHIKFTTSVDKDHPFIRLKERAPEISKDEFRSKMIKGFGEIEKYTRRMVNNELDLKNAGKTLPNVKFKDKLLKYMIKMVKSRIKIPVLYKFRDGILYISTVLTMDMADGNKSKQFALNENYNNEKIIELDI